MTENTIFLAVAGSPLSELIVFMFGLMFGSFFNVLVWRLPRSESIVSPGSHCPKCGRPVKPHENIPVISYLFLRGKCAGCRASISPIYPAMEIVTALFAVLLWILYVRPHLLMPQSAPWETTTTVIKALYLILLIPLSVIDLKHYIIPDSLTLPVVGIGLAISLFPGDTTPLQSIIGMACGGGSLLLIGKIAELALKKEEAMGGGDIKLMAAVGALWGWQVSLLSIMLGSCVGAVVGTGLLAFRSLGKDHKIPFGPFLAIGVWVAVLWGDGLIRWYMGLLQNAAM